MDMVGGFFQQRSDAQQVADALQLAGVEREAIHFQVLLSSQSLMDVLGPLGIPNEAIQVYERHVNPGDILLIIRTDKLATETVANEIARVGGLVVREGYYPAGFPGER